MSASIRLAQIWESRSVTASTADSVHATLREAIVSGVMRPGDRLSEEPLAEQLGVSRTPVREAVLRLETEQLVVRIPRRGLVVRGIESHEMTEIYMMRVAIDGLAANLAAQKATPVGVAKLRWLNTQMKQAAETGGVDLISECNIAFHEAVCEIAGNRMLAGFVDQVHGWVRRCEPNPFAHAGRGREGAGEHDRIVDAIEAGDGARAEALTRDHMRRSHDIRLKLLAGGQAGSRAPAMAWEGTGECPSE